MYLDVNESTNYRLAQRLELSGGKVAGAWRFKPGDIDQWMAHHKRWNEAARKSP